jgi:hypothetical protein
MSSTPFVIVPEDGVPMEGKQRVKQRYSKEEVARYIDQLCEMQVGQSCFIANCSPLDVAFLRKPAIEAGINLRFRQIECDEIHLTQGVRIWRMHGPLDDEDL